MGRKKKEKKLGEKLLKDVINRNRAANDYAQIRFKELKAKYPELVKMAATINVGDTFTEEHEIKKGKGMPAKIWSFLDSVNKLESKQNDYAEKINEIQINETLVNLLPGAFSRAGIDFQKRQISYKYGYEDLSHSVGWFKFLEDDKLYWFSSSENELINAKVSAGIQMAPYGFLKVEHDNGESVIYELDEFCMLSYRIPWSEFDDDDEKHGKDCGWFIIYSRDFALLNVEAILGESSLLSAKLPPIHPIL